MGIVKDLLQSYCKLTCFKEPFRQLTSTRNAKVEVRRPLCAGPCVSSILPNFHMELRNLHLVCSGSSMQASNPQTLGRPSSHVMLLGPRIFISKSPESKTCNRKSRLSTLVHPTAPTGAQNLTRCALVHRTRSASSPPSEADSARCYLEHTATSCLLHTNHSKYRYKTRISFIFLTMAPAQYTCERISTNHCHLPKCLLRAHSSNITTNPERAAKSIKTTASRKEMLFIWGLYLPPKLPTEP